MVQLYVEKAGTKTAQGKSLDRTWDQSPRCLSQTVVPWASLTKEQILPCTHVASICVLSKVVCCSEPQASMGWALFSPALAGGMARTLLSCQPQGSTGIFICCTQIPVWQGKDGCCHLHYKTGKLFSSSLGGGVRAWFHTNHTGMNVPATLPDLFFWAVVPDIFAQSVTEHDCSWCPQKPQL